MIVHYDCRYYKGHIPCDYHKQEGVHCEDCPHFDQIAERILIIKLGALGDVIRTTPILQALKKDYPQSKIFWLTHSPDLLPSSVDIKLTPTLENLLYLEEVPFDICINLDKDREACAVAQRIHSKRKFGFILKDGVPAPVDKLAEHKLYTGLFDDIGQQNSKSYLEEIFEICGYNFKGEKYSIEFSEREYKWSLPDGAYTVGLNTGCGSRWLTRLWPEKYWVELAVQLRKKGYRVLLLGGPDENDLNLRIQFKSNAHYPGTFPLQQFVSLVNQCELVVTTVTMALHLAIALEKRVVLLNNIFNRHEFELYGLGSILEPPNCTCYFAQTCDKDCMEELTVDEVLTAITVQLPIQ